MDKDVINYFNTCDICEKFKYQRHHTKLIYKATPIGQILYQIIDSFSKFGLAYLIISPITIEISDKLIQFISHYGILNKISCNNGLEFKNHKIQDFCLLHQIDIHYVTVYNCNSNSLVERFHSTLIKALRTLRNEKLDISLKHLMNYVILLYNDSIHTATDYTPLNYKKL